MNVTKANFSLIADEIVRLINSCDFFAVDQEMTGIEVPEATHDQLATVAELYPQKRAAASRYSAFQFGLCLFHKLEASGSDGSPTYEARPFNFQLRNGAGRDDVVLSLSGIDFLVKNSMDFQIWLAGGITFATLDAEAAERERLFPTLPSLSSGTEEERRWVEEYLSRLRRWRAEPDGDNKKLAVRCSHYSIAADLLLLASINHEFGATMIIEPPLDARIPRSRRETIFTSCTAEEHAAHLKNVYSRREAMLESFVGFRKIWSALVSSKKLHLGHNYSSDLMFMLHQHHTALPGSYSEFKQHVHELFPTIYDTKVIASLVSDPAFANTSLEALYKELRRRCRDQSAVVDVRLPLGFEAYDERVAHMQSAISGGTSAVAHQGAYDAYMTGVAFLQLRELYGQALLDRAVNLVGVFGCYYVMNLRDGGNAEDPLSPSDFVVLVSHPYTFENEDIEELFATDKQLEQLKAAHAQSQRNRAARIGGSGASVSRVSWPTKDFRFRRIDLTHHVVGFAACKTLEEVLGRATNPRASTPADGGGSAPDASDGVSACKRELPEGVFIEEFTVGVHALKASRNDEPQQKAARH